VKKGEEKKECGRFCVGGLWKVGLILSPGGDEMTRKNFVRVVIFFMGLIFLSLLAVGKGNSSQSITKKYFAYVKDNYGSPEFGPVMIDMVDDGTGNLTVQVTVPDGETGDPIFITGTGTKIGNNITFTLSVIMCSDTGSDGTGTAVFNGTIDSNGTITGTFKNTLPEGDRCRVNNSNVYEGIFIAEDVTNAPPIDIAGPYNFYWHPDGYLAGEGPVQVQVFQNGNNISINIPEIGQTGQGTIYGKYVVFRIPAILCEDTCFPNGTCPEPENATFIGKFNIETNTLEGYYGDGVPAGDYCHYPGNDTIITPATGMWLAVKTQVGGTYTFTVTKTGAGSGTVSASGCTLSWSGKTGTCQAPAGTQITLTAIPSSNSTFAGWSGGGCSGNGTCTITLNADTSVNATFKLKTFVLRVKKGGLGSGNVTATGCTLKWNGVAWICSAPYGREITLTGIPADNSTFGGWLNGTGSATICTGSQGSCTFRITEDSEVTARFKLNRYVLKVYKSGTGSGNVTADGCELRWNGVSAWVCTARHGTEIKLRGEPAQGFTFVGWANGTGSASICTGNGTCTFTLTENSTVRVRFK